MDLSAIQDKINALPYNVKSQFNAQDFEAKKVVKKHFIADDLKNAKTIADLKQILEKFNNEDSVSIEETMQHEEEHAFPVLDASITVERLETTSEIVARLEKKIVQLQTPRARKSV